MLSLNEIVNSEIGPRLGLFLGRVLSQRGIYNVADWLAARFTGRENTPLYRAIRSNQAVIRDLPYEAPELHQAVGEVLRNAARGYADWFQSMNEDRETQLARVSVDDHILASAFEASQAGHGVIYAGAHMSSFNMFLMALGLLNVDIQVLSYARVRGSYRTDNAFRERFGIRITPVSVRSLREAFRRLRQKGFVLTGVDRPDLGGEPLTFFGRKVRLPVGHARLAVRTGAYVIAGVCHSLGGGCYHVTAPSIIKPKITGDEHRDSMRLAQQVIEILEGYIRKQPSEWLMFLPVWPQEHPHIFQSGAAGLDFREG